MMTIEEASSSPRPVIRGKPNRATTFRGSSVDESKRKQIKKTVERGKSFLDKKQSLEEFADREKHVSGRVLVFFLLSLLIFVTVY